jgi:hypothetical protein
MGRLNCSTNRLLDDASGLGVRLIRCGRSLERIDVNLRPSICIDPAPQLPPAPKAEKKIRMNLMMSSSYPDCCGSHRSPGHQYDAGSPAVILVLRSATKWLRLYG